MELWMVFFIKKRLKLANLPAQCAVRRRSANYFLHVEIAEVLRCCN